VNQACAEKKHQGVFFVSFLNPYLLTLFVICASLSFLPSAFASVLVYDIFL